MKKLLIIDDEYIILQGLKHLLNWEQHGYEVVFDTQSPHDALNYIKNNPVDIVMSDIVMPELSGLELLQCIKTFNKNIHVVMVSSHSDFEYTRQALKLGASDYILKPNLKPELVLNVLDELKIENRQDHTQDLKYILRRDLRSFMLGQKIMPDTTEYFIYPYFSLFFSSASKPENLDAVSDYLHLSFPDDGCEITIINTQKPINHNPISESGYVLNLTDINSLEAYYKVYQLQREISFYHLGESFELDLKFAWKLRPNFEYENGLNTHASHQLYSTLNHLYTYVLDLLQQECYSPLELKSFISNALYQVMNQIERQNIQSTSTTAFKLQLVYQIQNANTSKDLRNQINTLLSDLSIIIQSYIKQGDIDFRDRMFEYLEDNYQEPIGLDDLAQHFNFSYHYMSELFNNHFHSSFSDILNNLRVEKAKELLDSSDDSLKDISQKVGYANYSHFSKLFKKITHISPTDYKRGNH